MARLLFCTIAAWESPTRTKGQKGVRMDKKIIMLQLFADGGAGGAGGGDGGDAAAASGAPQADQRLPARGKRRENPLANVTYGKIPQAQQVEEPAQTDAAAPKEQDNVESFEDLIKGKYKKDFDQRVQRIVQDRLKGSYERESKVNPIIEQVARRYGMDHTAEDFSLDALSEAIAGDTSQYEAEALEKGLPVETVARLHKLEFMEEQKQKQAEMQAKQTQIQRHLEDMVRQGEQLKQLYPGFNLEAELQNPEFVRLTAPGVGVGVRTAYEVVHRDEMRGAEMQFAAQKAAQRVSASVAANAKRPAENGVNGSSAAINKSDPSQLTKADRAEIRRRVQAGEKICF